MSRQNYQNSPAGCGCLTVFIVIAIISTIVEYISNNPLVLIPIIIVVAGVITLIVHNKKVQREYEEQKRLEEIENKRLRRYNLNEKLKDLKEGKAEPLDVNGVVLAADEYCYIGESVIAGKEKANLELTDGMFYVTTQRLILAAGKVNFDKKLDQLTSITADEERIRVQLGATSYIVRVNEADILKDCIDVLISKRIEDLKDNKRKNGTKKCEYCGIDNNSKSKFCEHCGAPLNS